MTFIDGKTLKKSNGKYGFPGDMNITKSLWLNPWSLTECEFHQQSRLSAFLFHFKELFSSHGSDGFTDLTVNHQRSWSTPAFKGFKTGELNFWETIVIITWPFHRHHIATVWNSDILKKGWSTCQIWYGTFVDYSQQKRSRVKKGRNFICKNLLQSRNYKFIALIVAQYLTVFFNCMTK